MNGKTSWVMEHQNNEIWNHYRHPQQSDSLARRIVSCIVLYVGAMELMPASGEVMTRENIWHGVLSFGGMLMIFLTYCLYAFFIRKKDRDGVFILVCLLAFSLITSAFSVLNIFDERSYVVASAAAELYVLTIMSLVGYLTYYLAYRKMRESHLL